jgi:hypothetical protein
MVGRSGYGVKEQAEWRGGKAEKQDLQAMIPIPSKGEHERNEK